MNRWLRQLPDSRDQDLIVYPREFLAWYGLLLYVLQLGSRRQLDYELRAVGTQVVPNLNRLAETDLDRRPVHDTLDYFVGHTTVAGWEKLRTQLNQRLLRMKVFEPARLLGHVLLVLDGTGHLAFGKKHCDRCLRQRHGNTTVYLHQVLEAKFVGPGGLLASAGSVFIENDPQWDKLPADERKQMCELLAFEKLARALKAAYPQLKICVLVDALYACGRFFQIIEELGWTFVVTFKEGRMPALWREFAALVKAQPNQVVCLQQPDGTEQEYRWMNDLDYEDSDHRRWKLHAVQCLETSAKGETKRFAWLTRLPLGRRTLQAVAEQGGRQRWLIENQGFNRQKNSGLRMEHVYSVHPEKLKVYYLLLQIAFLLLLLVEKGSLLQKLLEEWDQDLHHWYGSLKNLAQRLLESLRYLTWPEEAFRRTRRRVIIDSS